MLRIVLLCMLASCIDQSLTEIDPTEHAGVENGFGYPCTPVYDPNELITRCYGDNHTPGMCALGICRQECVDERTCPPGYDAILTVESRCWCDPRRAPWDMVDIAPEMN